jgi:hypothetical protein
MVKDILEILLLLFPGKNFLLRTSLPSPFILLERLPASRLSRTEEKLSVCKIAIQSRRGDDFSAERLSLDRN